MVKLAMIFYGPHSISTTLASEGIDHTRRAGSQLKKYIYFYNLKNQAEWSL